MRDVQVFSSEQILEARTDVARVAETHPDLDLYGIPTSAPVEKRVELRQSLFSDRFAMEFAHCRVWLRTAPRIRYFNPHVQSYWIKHIVEHIAGVYVPNGALIAAALCEGFAYRIASPNLQVGIPRKWLEQQDEIGRARKAGSPDPPPSMTRAERDKLRRDFEKRYWPECRRCYAAGLPLPDMKPPPGAYEEHPPPWRCRRAYKTP